MMHFMILKVNQYYNILMFGSIFFNLKKNSKYRLKNDTHTVVISLDK